MKNALLISTARAGSTSLREMLDALEGVVFHGEILGANRILGISPKLKNTGPSVEDRTFDRYLFEKSLLSPLNVSMIGFKVLLSHFFHPPNAFYLQRFLDRKPKVIFLWRRNLIARFRSECLLRHDSGFLPVAKFNKLSKRDVCADAELQISMAKWVLQIVRSHGLEILMCEYETIFHDAYNRNEIVQFLELGSLSIGARKDRRSKANEGREKPDFLQVIRDEDYPQYIDVDVRGLQ